MFVVLYLQSSTLYHPPGKSVRSLSSLIARSLMAPILTSFSSLTFCLTLHNLSLVLSFPWIHPSSSPAAFLWAHIFCLVWQMYCVNNITKLFWMILIRMFLSFPYLLGFWHSSSHPLFYCSKACNENDQGFPSSSKYTFCLSLVQNIKSRTASFSNLRKCVPLTPHLVGI